MAARKNPEHEKCALYAQHTELRSDLEKAKIMANENREMIQANHLEAMRMISDMNKSHSEEFGKIVLTMTETNLKFDKLNTTVERTSRIFAWWDSLPCKIRMFAKIALSIVTIMGSITVIINFFEKILGY